MANFVSGLIVLAERPIRIGDVVTVGNVSGTVLRIHARATVVMDFDYKEVIIPNKAFITERVVNWTLSSQTTRLLIKVGVAYGSDIDLAQRVILAAVRGNRDVLQDPGPSVFFVAFGESTLDFEIRAFVNSIDKRLRVQHEINNEVARVLRENGIEIPFPQRDLHIRSAPGLAGALGGDQAGVGFAIAEVLQSARGSETLILHRCTQSSNTFPLRLWPRWRGYPRRASARRISSRGRTPIPRSGSTSSLRVTPLRPAASQSMHRCR